jgi:PAS domain S-box-containing protein
VIDRLADGVVMLDAAMTVVDTNVAFADMVGATKTDVIGKPMHTLLGDGFELVTNDDGSLTEQEVELRTATGDTALVRVTGRRDSDGTVLSLRADKSTAGIEIVSTVSHELRSPLTSVKGYTSLLLNRWDRLADDQKKMMLEQIHHDADRVTRLITELLDISRLETGRLVLRREMVDLGAIS